MKHLSKIPLLCAVFALFFLLGCEKQPAISPSAPPSSTEDPLPPPPPPKPSVWELCRERAAAMPVEQQVGQLFFVRCPETGAAEDVAAYHLGGLLLFGRDFKDRTADEVRATLQRYQAAADLPLLIGVDEEGGTVVRVSSNPALAPARFSSPQKLYQKGGLEAVAADARAKSQLLWALGINVNFAPVADVSTSAGDFIYQRAFGQPAAETARYVETVVSAMQHFDDTQERRMGSVLKHFPGYGNNVDTHTGIAVDARPADRFFQEDLLPFAAGIDAGADSVLVSHNIVTCFDDTMPASLSAPVHALLRQELGFSGVILTDDLAMDAVQAYAKDGGAAVLALQAGNDMVVTTDYQTEIPRVIAAVEAGAIDRAALTDSVARVLLWKVRLGLLSPEEGSSAA